MTEAQQTSKINEALVHLINGEKMRVFEIYSQMKHVERCDLYDIFTSLANRDKKQIFEIYSQMNRVERRDQCDVFTSLDYNCYTKVFAQIDRMPEAAQIDRMLETDVNMNTESTDEIDFLYPARGNALNKDIMIKVFKDEPDIFFKEYDLIIENFEEDETKLHLRLGLESDECAQINAYRKSASTRSPLDNFRKRQDMFCQSHRELISVYQDEQPDLVGVFKKVPLSLLGILWKQYGYGSGYIDFVSGAFRRFLSIFQYAHEADLSAFKDTLEKIGKNLSQSDLIKEITQRNEMTVNQLNKLCELMALSPSIKAKCFIRMFGQFDPQEISKFKKSLQEDARQLPQNELFEDMKQRKEMTFRDFQQLYIFLDCSLDMFEEKDRDVIQDMLEETGEDADASVVFNGGAFCKFHIKHNMSDICTPRSDNDTNMVKFFQAYFRHQELVEKQYIEEHSHAHPLDFDTTYNDLYIVECLRNYMMVSATAKSVLGASLANNANLTAIARSLDIKSIAAAYQVIDEAEGLPDALKICKALRTILNTYVKADQADMNPVDVYHAILLDEARTPSHQQIDQESKDQFSQQKFGIWPRIQMMYMWCVNKIKNLIEDWFPSEKSRNVLPLNTPKPLGGLELCNPDNMSPHQEERKEVDGTFHSQFSRQAAV